MFLDELSEPHRSVAMVAEREVGLEVLLEHGETHLLQARTLDDGEGLIDEVSERRADPQAQRLAETRGGLGGVAAGTCAAGLDDELLEAQRIDVVGVDCQEIAAA